MSLKKKRKKDKPKLKLVKRPVIGGTEKTLTIAFFLMAFMYAWDRALSEHKLTVVLSWAKRIEEGDFEVPL